MVANLSTCLAALIIILVGEGQHPDTLKKSLERAAAAAVVCSIIMTDDSITAKIQKADELWRQAESQVPSDHTPVYQFLKELDQQHAGQCAGQVAPGEGVQRHVRSQRKNEQ